MSITFKSLIMSMPALAISASLALAQDTPAPAPEVSSAAVEVVPFIALGSNGAWPIGAAISFPLTQNFSLEAEVGYRRGEGGINALSSNASLLYALPRVGRTTPYLAAGAGLAQYGVPVAAPDGSVLFTQPTVGLLVNAGGGVKVDVDDTWGMRTDARWFKSFGRHGSEHWRVSQGVSFDVGKR